MTMSGARISAWILGSRSVPAGRDKQTYRATPDWNCGNRHKWICQDEIAKRQEATAEIYHYYCASAEFVVPIDGAKRRRLEREFVSQKSAPGRRGRDNDRVEMRQTWLALTMARYKIGSREKRNHRMCRVEIASRRRVIYGHLDSYQLFTLSQHNFSSNMIKKEELQEYPAESLTIVSFISFFLKIQQINS